MNYQEAILATVSREDARREILKHNLPFEDFIHDLGDHQEYSGEDILGWLGY